MPSLNPSREQLAAFAEQMPDDAPIRDAQPAALPRGGRLPARQRKHAPAAGARPIGAGSRTAPGQGAGRGRQVELLAAAQVALIAPRANSGTSCCWCATLEGGLLGMLADPEYRAATVHRTAACWPTRG